MEFVAGISTGIAIALSAWLVYAVIHFRRRVAETDRERKLLLNKAFVRDGQAKLFPDSVVNEGLETQDEPRTPKPPIKLQSPFRAGRQKLREFVAGGRGERTDAANNLPPNVQQAIIEKAESLKEQAA